MEVNYTFHTSLWIFVRFFSTLHSFCFLSQMVYHTYVIRHLKVIERFKSQFLLRDVGVSFSPRFLYMARDYARESRSLFFLLEFHYDRASRSLLLDSYYCCSRVPSEYSMPKLTN